MSLFKHPAAVDRQRRKPACFTLALMVIGTLLAPQVAFCSHAEAKNEIRVAFIYNIFRFITWPQQLPARTDNTMTICLFHHNFLGDALETLKSKQIHKRPLHTRVIQSLTEVEPCDALVIPGRQMDGFREEFAQYGLPEHTLTLADFSGTLHEHVPHEGISIALIRKGVNLGFEINLRAMRQRGFSASSELLKLAIITEESPP